MTVDELRKTKKQVMARYRPYSNVDLSGMVMDCHAYLDQSSIIRLAQRKTKKTGDPSSMFAVYCEPTSEAVTIPDIVAELERIWMDDLRFTEEAHAVVRADSEIILDFVTWWKNTGSYVTGNIVVDVHKKQLWAWYGLCRRI